MKIRCKAEVMQFPPQLRYKAARHRVKVADCWQPSSWMCSSCGYRLEELALGTRS